jgi:alanine dehydrogenase
MSLERDPARPLLVDSFAIAEHIDQGLAVEAARLAAQIRSAGHVETRRATLPLPGGWMRMMACSLPTLGIFGYKEFHLAPNNSVRYTVHAFDLADGKPLGVVDAALVTTVRTAATAAVAIESMVGVGAQVRVGVIGTGAEALAGLRAIAHLLDVAELKVTSRREVNREKFLGSAAEELGIVGTGVDHAAAATEGADVVYVATNSGGNIVVRPADIVGVPCIASIGSTLPQQRELDGQVLVDADQVIIDTWDVLEESGDALAARAAGLDPARIRLLGDALDGERPGTRGSCIYKSIGSPEQDLVLAAAILRAAEDGGFGRTLEPLAAIKTNL